MASFTHPTRMGINERGALTSVLGGALCRQRLFVNQISLSYFSIYLDSFFNLLRIF